MQRKQLADGVMLTDIPAERFKTGRITLNFILPSQRSTATAAALLPLVLERSCAAWPDMTEFSKVLAKLYGASLSAESAVYGNRRVISVSISGIKDCYALDGEALSQEYARVLFEVAFRPHFTDGVFDEEALEIEKQKLREALENEINEKRTYCIRQAKRRFFGDSPNGVEKNGYLDEVDGITAQQLTAFYHEMIRSAVIEIMVIGADAAQVGESIAVQLSQVERAPSLPEAPSAMPRTAPLVIKEPMDTVQGKLCLLFTTDAIFNEADEAKLRLATAIYGSLPTSRLFMNVREKQSLCYYCVAGYAPMSGMFMVDSGIEHQNAEKAKDAILAELEALCKVPVPETELEEAKLALCSAMTGVGDSLNGLENWYFGGILKGRIRTPEEAKARIQQISAADIQEMLSHLSLSVAYFLTKEEPTHDAN